MRFSNRGYHRSSGIETMASNLSAIEYMIGFRRRHRKVFTVYLVITLAFVVFILFVMFGPLLFPGLRSSGSGSRSDSGSVSNGARSVGVGVDYNQPTEVTYEDPVHTQASGGYQSSIRYWFSTDYLIGNGVNRGDACSITFRVLFRDGSGGVQGSSYETFSVIAGETYEYTTSVVLAGYYIQTDDIVGFDFL